MGTAYFEVPYGVLADLLHLPPLAEIVGIQDTQYNRFEITVSHPDLPNWQPGEPLERACPTWRKNEPTEFVDWGLGG